MKARAMEILTLDREDGSTMASDFYLEISLQF